LILTSTIGFPRIGEKRELKKSIESSWKGNIQNDELIKDAESVKMRNYSIQKEKGLDLIPSNDFSFYDSILDHSIMLGQIPKRYLEFGKPTSLDVYFAMARGKGQVTALGMTKWFDTNYHYIVPELVGEFKITENLPLKEYNWAKEKGIKTKPVIIGMYTYLKLAKIKDTNALKENLMKLAPCYSKILGDLSEAGVEYVQIDEPALIFGEDNEIIKLVGELYNKVAQFKGNSKWILQTYFEDIHEHYDEVIRWPFDYIGLDFIRGKKTLSTMKSKGLPEGKKLAIGIIDSRNIWKSDFKEIANLLNEIKSVGLLDGAIIQPSSSLLHVPYSTSFEKDIPKELHDAFAFALEKLDELTKIKNSLNKDKIELLKELKSPPALSKSKRVQARLKNITNKDFQRTKPFPERIELQKRKLDLPILPTTTIGSFPQTKEVRKIRASWKSKKITGKEYKEFIRNEIKSVIKLQEDIGLDVLVHGEFERTDMVEFFGQKLKGFFFTKNGWVQSYGTRCVKPPIICGDVERTAPMTVEKISFAQSQTSKPMKGMLTGPITILNWSFPRKDIPKKEITYQIALALREETIDLEEKGIKIIQIDEPALREGLPIKPSYRREYLDWAIKGFRLCSSGVKDETQIHTHMCYCEFNEIIEDIYALDADVISIENARNSDELLKVFKEFNYNHHIGPGVYDVHSERIPPVPEIENKIKKISNHINKELLWINPDCGLKTRDFPETIESLKNMVKATQNLRGKL